MSSEQRPEFVPTPGMLLVASADLLDPNFVGTVIALISVDEHGSVGLVLNRPSPVPVAEVLAGWRDQVDEPDVLFSGGPCETDGALAVGLLAGADEPEDAVGFRSISGRLGLVDLDVPVELIGDGLQRLRIFAGYAGWGVGQLEAELAQGSWHLVPGRAEDLFTEDVVDLRRDVLRRQPGDLAWLSTRPSDPELN